jgi:hypothetical protein
MPSGKRWGKAGVQLTSQEMQSRDFRGTAWRTHKQESRIASDRIAKVKWAAGLLVPHYITTSLDIHCLDGPEVDIACGATESDVDMWEAGVLYPAWEQVLLLSELTGWYPCKFTRPPGDMIEFSHTSMRFHTLDSLNDPPFVWQFTAEAIAAMEATLR